MDVAEGSSVVVVSAVDVEVEGPSSRAEAAGVSSVSGACLRLRDLSWARRALRSLAAAESFSWDDIVSFLALCVSRRHVCPGARKGGLGGRRVGARYSRS